MNKNIKSIKKFIKYISRIALGMTKEDIKKAVIIGIVCGFTTVVTIYSLAFTYVKVSEWYRDYKRELVERKLDPTPPDSRSGSFCPECKSTDVGRYVYGYWNPDADSATAKAVHSGIIIYGGKDFRVFTTIRESISCAYAYDNRH